uniref:Cytochrome b n=1 Tax=Eustenogaster scitula TaxID=1980568 RepID=A0A509ZTI5_9HYME|nr:cytochrome b [Eustenogaster scitula]ARO89849.1 cytochrome b [Eustenogaster scitula]
MNKSLMKKNNLLSILNNSLIIFPSPMNISYWWNMGSLLGLMLMIQIISGLFLSIHYCPNINLAFQSINHINMDVKYGWLIHYIHMNGASMFFLLIYMHIGRNIYYHSFNLIYTWFSGMLILFLSMATAFLGYVLPWGQMSFWGATVITNLLSAIPYIGNNIVLWLWGGFSINNATLNRFFSFHFILPFIIMLIVMIHLMFLHSTGSSNPLGMNSKLYMIPFHIYFTLKDILGMMIIMMILSIMSLQYPFLLNDPDNFILASPMVTPPHIKPEWYFLFAYAILRSIPNKLGGVLALFSSILILFILPFNSKNLLNSSKFNLINQLTFWTFCTSFFMLTWTGGCMIEYPFIQISQFFTIMYFSYFIFMNILNMEWNKNIFS